MPENSYKGVVRAHGDTVKKDEMQKDLINKEDG